MSFKAENFEHLLGIKGFSNTLLKNHFSLYIGYVKNTNAVIEAVQKGEGNTAELRRRFGWEFCGMRLHELYFANMSKEPKEFDKSSGFGKKLLEGFGSFEAWKNDFRANALRGIGWIVLYYDKKAGRLFNVWIGEHNENNLSGCIPLLVMDLWEHAFMADFGLDKSGYIDAFFGVIDWKKVEERFGR